MNYTKEQMIEHIKIDKTSLREHWWICFPTYIPELSDLKEHLDMLKGLSESNSGLINFIIENYSDTNSNREEIRKLLDKVDFHSYDLLDFIEDNFPDLVKKARGEEISMGPEDTDDDLGTTGTPSGDGGDDSGTGTDDSGQEDDNE